MATDSWSVRLGLDVGYRLPEQEADELEQRAGDLVDEPTVATTEHGADIAFWIEGEWTDAAAAAHRLSDHLAHPVAEVAIRTQRVVEQELARPTLPDLLGATEVSERLGISRQRVHQLHTSHPDFPAALVEVAMGPLWDARAVARFERDWDRRPGRRATVTTPISNGDSERTEVHQ